jgi:signal transduction histidine kinase
MDSLKFSPDILARLGEELVPGIDQAILELVRNAYDADAVSCTVKLSGVNQPGGTLIIEDDGIGMSRYNIRHGWLVLGKSKKKDSPRTKKFMRQPVGEKGLGRLAALRQGSTALLETRSSRLPSVQYRLEINWGRFEKADTVEDVELPITRVFCQGTPGTTITVSALRDSPTEEQLLQLARGLALLANPFDKTTGFTPKLQVEGRPDLALTVEKGLFAEADYHLLAHLNSDGTASAEVYDRSGSLKFSTGDEGLPTGPFTAPETDFEFWSYNSRLAPFTPSISREDIESWLNSFGGVHVYHRGLRVLPYGDRGHDWLEINLLRTINPEMRPRSDRSIGRMLIDDPDGRLIPKTDRSGFIASADFEGLKKFGRAALEWMAKERVRERDETNKNRQTDVEKELDVAKGALTEAYTTLTEEQRKPIRAAVQRIERLNREQLKNVKKELQLYRTLATVGTTAAVFAHETAQPVTRIKGSGNEIIDILMSGHSTEDLAMVIEHSQIIVRAADALAGFASMPIRLLGKEKRERRLVLLEDAIREIIDLMLPFLTEAGITVRINMPPDNAVVYGTTAALQAIVANLLTNAAYALIYKSDEEEKAIQVDVLRSIDRLTLSVSDNGPGITEISVKDIWLPGETTRPAGTGLGLTIVRDSVQDMGGTATVKSPGKIGGAEFIVTLPLYSERK